jgi:mono/diheme cytochrome c family protein
MAGISWLRKDRNRAWRIAPVVCAVALLMDWTAGPTAVDAAPARPATTFKQIKPLLQANCFQCHGEKKQKGGVNFSLIGDEKSILRNRKLWHMVVTQLESNEMPPEEADEQPTDEQRKTLVQWMKHAAEVDCSDPANHDPGPPLIRRLSVREYSRTMKDLTGIDFNVAEAVGMTDEGNGLGFDNLAAAMEIAPTLMEKYFEAADQILDRVFAATDLKPAGLTVDGRVRTQSLAAYKRIVFARPGDGVSAHDAGEKVLRRFARRAYRRPVTAAEVGRLTKLFDTLISRGQSFDAAMRLTLKPILVSPYFLLRVERDGAAGGSDAAYRVTDHELAVRLSYFLWSSMPDAELDALADAGKLSDPATLDRQVKRMLDDPKARSLTEGFAEQFLQLKKFASARPSTEFFPSFNGDLKRAMHDETSIFFDKLREEDRSVLELLDADYTYVNETLAKHYGIDGVKGSQMRRVALPPAAHRGGLLGMGSILALTSHTSRTSPTLRGKYVLDVIFGTPPDPPPANAGQFKDEGNRKDPKSFREKMAQHAADASCASCHKKMDPLGYALENFNAIGAWREKDGERPVDNSGRLPGGEQFTGVAGLKKIVHAHEEDFVRNMTGNMLVYALGRELDYYDDCVVKEIETAMAGDGYKFSALIGGIVKSYPFQYRKTAAPAIAKEVK